MDLSHDGTQPAATAFASRATAAVATRTAAIAFKSLRDRLRIASMQGPVPLCPNAPLRQAQGRLLRHARTCSGHPYGRPKRWREMPGTSPGMTRRGRGNALRPVLIRPDANSQTDTDHTRSPYSIFPAAAAVRASLRHDRAATASSVTASKQGPERNGPLRNDAGDEQDGQCIHLLHDALPSRLVSVSASTRAGWRRTRGCNGRPPAPLAAAGVTLKQVAIPPGPRWAPKWRLREPAEQPQTRPCVSWFFPFESRAWVPAAAVT